MKRGASGGKIVTTVASCRLHPALNQEDIMDRRMIRYAFAIVGILSGAFSLRAPAWAAQELPAARVSDLQGQLAVRGTGDAEPTFVARNTTLRPGDLLWTDAKGHAEVELDRGTWLRLAEDTKIELKELSPKPTVRIWTGSVYADLSDRAAALHVSTPSGDVDVDPNSVVRVDLSKKDSTRVTVQHGMAQVSGTCGSPVHANAGTRVYADVGKAAEEAKRFDYSDRDGFDQYQRNRTDYYVDRPLSRHQDQDFPGARELDRDGNWVEVEKHYYWKPNVGSDWRPYSSGYWDYVPDYGYCW